jgi:hypothetical protein
MPQPTQAQSSNQEGRILLAIDAIKNGHLKSIRQAAASYDVPRATIQRRIHGMTPRRDSTPNLQKLTPYEESALVQYILDLDSRGFPPRPQDVQEMADLLLSERGKSPVGKNWATNFIKRRTEIKAKFSRKYDYKRAKCEDPKIIQGWFFLVRNTVAKYGILEQDIYNFDEAGFAMGVIATAKVVTSSEARSRPKTIQPGNREWVSIIQGVNSYGWALPPFIIFKAQRDQDDQIWLEIACIFNFHQVLQFRSYNELAKYYKGPSVSKECHRRAPIMAKLQDTWGVDFHVELGDLWPFPSRTLLEQLSKLSQTQSLGDSKILLKAQIQERLSSSVPKTRKAHIIMVKDVNSILEKIERGKLLLEPSFAQRISTAIS